MSWQESRAGAVATTARRTAHADDAKDRTDETHRVPKRRARARWLVPALVAGALLLIGGGATAALVASGGEDPTPGSTSSGSDRANSSGPASDGAAADAVTTWSATITCLSTGSTFRGKVGCDPVPETGVLECPEGVCRLPLFYGGARLTTSLTTITGGLGTVRYSFAELDTTRPSASWTGTVQGWGPSCPDAPVQVAGTRQPDGSYQVLVTRVEQIPVFTGSGNRPTGCENSPGAQDQVVLKPGG